jgi:hypothetical protein
MRPWCLIGVPLLVLGSVPFATIWRSGGGFELRWHCIERGSLGLHLGRGWGPVGRQVGVTVAAQDLAREARGGAVAVLAALVQGGDDPPGALVGHAPPGGVGSRIQSLGPIRRLS